MSPLAPYFREKGVLLFFGWWNWWNWCIKKRNSVSLCLSTAFVCVFQSIPIGIYTVHGQKAQQRHSKGIAKGREARAERQIKGKARRQKRHSKGRKRQGGKGSGKFTPLTKRLPPKAPIPPVPPGALGGHSISTRHSLGHQSDQTLRSARILRKA